jgi:hypothetical protein
MHIHVRTLKRCRYLILSIVLFANILVVLTPRSAAAVSAGGVISLTNAQRAAAGLSPLAYNGMLASSAYAKAQDMLAKNYWAHTSPDGLTAWTFIRASGYPYIAAGENLAKDFASDSDAVAAWMASPGHRANMLSSSYRDMGVAVVNGTLMGAQTTLVVAHFGAMAAAPAPAPAPAPKPAAVATKPKPVAPQPAAAPVAQPAPVAAAAAVEPVKVIPSPVPAPTTESQKPTKPTFGKRLWDLIQAMNERLLIALAVTKPVA